jgi:hypothetical protein
MNYNEQDERQIIGPGSCALILVSTAVIAQMTSTLAAVPALVLLQTNATS